MPAVSVIMAVYEAEETIARAVASVLDQTFTDLELVLVDDASSDNSVEVVERLVAERGDARVRILRHDRNRRAAAARNTGVAAATGEFVTFIDSDDEYLPTYLQVLVDAAAPGVDIVVGSVVYVLPDGTRRTRRPAVTGDFSGTKAAELGLFDKITPFTCDKLIRRSLYDSVRFPEGIINEDFLTNPVLAASATTVRVVDEGIYLYYMRGTSVTWGASAPVGELDVAEHYLRDNLLAPGAHPELEPAVAHAMVFLTLSSAQRALIKSPQTPHDREVVRSCRRRLRLGTLLRLAPRSPVIVAGALLLKTVPSVYTALYRRHVRQNYGQDT